MADSGAFAGFPAWGVNFYQELEDDNTKELWAANKARWEREVREPMLALVDELEDEFGPAKLFRPNRDMRFSADKSPYKTHQGAIVGQTAGVGYYVQISGDGLAVGGGFRTHSPAQTESFRRAIAAAGSGVEFERIVAGLVGAGFDLEGATLKTRPKGFVIDHPRLDLLRRKEILAIKRVGTPDWLSKPAALQHVQAAWRDIRPLTEWVIANVPPVTETRGGRA
ncbi:MAG: DUF2461 domain-containing protein [Pedococcus sp.]